MLRFLVDFKAADDGGLAPAEENNAERCRKAVYRGGFGFSSYA